MIPCCYCCKSCASRIHAALQREHGSKAFLHGNCRRRVCHVAVHDCTLTVRFACTKARRPVRTALSVNSSGSPGPAPTRVTVPYRRMALLL